MRYRVLTKTAWKISAISMGCWAIGGEWGGMSDETANQTVQAAIDAGVNLFDTADGYGTGLAEVRLGTALGTRRKDVLIATKVGNWGRKHGHPLSFTSPHHVYLCCHASLYRLKTEYIDLYQCHIPRPEHPEVFLEAFDRLKQEGKIRAFGISTDDLDALKRFNANDTCATCQLRYSMLDRTAETELLPYCKAKGIGVFVRGPLEQGLLTGKFNADWKFDDGVRSTWNDGESRDRFLRRLQCAEQLKFLHRPTRNLSQAALQFVLTHPAVSCAIPGMKSAQQASANAAASGETLTEIEMKRVDQVVQPGAVVS